MLNEYENSNNLKIQKPATVNSNYNKENFGINAEENMESVKNEQPTVILNCPEDSEEHIQSILENEENEIVKLTAKINSISNHHESEFYKKAQDYWSNVPATVNGMLGGLGYISAVDIQGSSNFLRELRIPRNKCALDCGAGIGRVTKNLLMPRFDCVDMVEQDENFTKTARSYCCNESETRLGEIYTMGLQEFVPAKGKYDLIWSQWVLGHLTNEDLYEFFCRLQIGLASGGYFVMKENITTSKTIEKDETDSSVTRPLKDYERILRKCGFKIVKTTRQQSFPKGLYPVYMIACKVQTN